MTEQSSRAARLMLIVAAHLLLILWFIARPAAPLTIPVGSSTIVLIALSDPGQPAPPAPRPTQPAAVADPLPLPPIKISLPSMLPVEAVSGATAPSSGAAIGGCQLADQVATAIRQDPAAMADLAEMPPGLRTQADAVMMWNMRWLGDDVTQSLLPASQPRIEQIKRVVQGLVEAAPAECRAAVNTGPIFMAIPETSRTTTLVVGSGNWRWDDLLAPANCLPNKENRCVATLNAQ